MKLDFYNCPNPEDINLQKVPEPPVFLSYEPDFELMKSLAQEYDKYENILIVGHGGSVNPAYGLYFALKHKAKKQIYFLNTTDPDYIYELKKTLNSQNTVVLATSKSGETITQIEALSQFMEYPLICITGKNSPLRAMAEKLGAKIILHPAIGGRYTGLTEVNLLPLALAGINVKNLTEGAKDLFRQYEKNNLAWKAASIFYQLEEKGFVDVFMPVYSHYLFPFSALIVQLCHESFGKNSKGQTYFAHEAPESQHHTNQRFFGGRKNIAGFFMSVDAFNHNTEVVYPTQIHSVHIKNRAIFDVSKIPLAKTMEFEMQGTLEDARITGIPVAHLSLSSFEEKEIGSVTAFWQLYAVYASVLRNVNPFDQPQVENSKKISFNKRLLFKGLE